MRITLPRFVIAKPIKGHLAYYWNPPTYWRKQAEAGGRPWPFASQPLGFDFSQRDLDAAAVPHNGLFDEWRQGVRADGERRYALPGTVEWLFETYLESETFKRRVGERSRDDYRLIFGKVAAVPTKDGRTFGKLLVASVSPAAAGKIYDKMVEGGTFRQGEKAVMYCKTAWRLMQPHHPGHFRTDVPNPWTGVQLISYTPATKAAVDRAAVYAFASKAIEMVLPEFAAAAVICFEWLQRPENVVAGYIRWSDYRPGESIQITHHKTGEAVRHPLRDKDGSLFYGEAEAVLAQLPKRGISMVLRSDGTAYLATRSAQIVRTIADAAELPKTFTLDACRHGGMTELEEAELTDGQGRALSAHRSKAYEGYAKRTATRVLGATQKRIAHRKTT